MAGKRMLKKILTNLGLGLLAVLMIAAVYVTAVILSDSEEDQQKEWLVEEEQAPITPLQPADTSDPQALADLFGAPLPVLRGAALQGSARNDTHDGQTVRVATLTYQDMVITAVRPVSAAPLLLRPELSLSLRSDLTVLNLPAALAEQDAAYCLYFSDTLAAYSLYGEGMTEDAFLAQVDQFRLLRPQRSE